MLSVLVFGSFGVSSLASALLPVSLVLVLFNNKYLIGFFTDKYSTGDFATSPDESPFAAMFKEGLELGPIEVLKSPGLEVSFPVTAERKKR